MKKPKILLIEDMMELVECMVFVLSDEYEVVHSLDRTEIESIVESVDLVICDYHFSPTLKFGHVVEIVADRVPLVLCSSDPNVSYKNQLDKSRLHIEMRPKIAELLKKVS